MAGIFLTGKLLVGFSIIASPDSAYMNYSPRAVKSLEHL